MKMSNIFLFFHKEIYLLKGNVLNKITYEFTQRVLRNQRAPTQSLVPFKPSKSVWAAWKGLVCCKREFTVTSLYSSLHFSSVQFPLHITFFFFFLTYYTKFLHFSPSFFCSLVRIVLIDLFFELVPRENKCVCIGLASLLQTIVIAGTTSVCWFSPRMRFLWKAFTFPFSQSLSHNCSFCLPYTPIFSHVSVPSCVLEWAFVLFAFQILQNSPNTFFSLTSTKLLWDFHDFSAKQYDAYAALGLYCMLPRAQTSCILSRSTLFHVLLCLQVHSTKCWSLSLYRTVLALLSVFRVLQAL